MVAGVLLGVAWVRMLAASAETLSFEPNSDAARATTASARAPMLLWAGAEIAAALVLAAVTGRRWPAVLAAPGLTVLAVAVFSPTSNGGALMLGLLVTVVAAVAAPVLRAREVSRRAQR
jgi:hypothetical protein